MKIREWRDQYTRVGVSDEVLFAGEFLEARGFFFLTDFGTGTAIEKATEVLMDSVENSGGKKWR